MMDNKISDFKTKGFAHLKGYFDESSLDKLLLDSTNILDKSKKGYWNHIRVYRDFFTFEGLNIFGIDFPLNKKINETIYDNFNRLNYKNDVLKILNWEDFQTTTVRLHSNSDFFNYQGAWHRDNSHYPSPNSIQAILYLKDEDGFRIVPRSMNHKLEQYGISCNTNINNDNLQFASLSKDMYEIINAKKGDVFIFESGLLHQGYCKSSRLHFHLRHEKSKAVFNNDINTNIYNFTDNLLPNYDLSEIEFNENLFKYDLKSVLLRLKRTLVYFFPRFNILLNNLRGKTRQETRASSFWQ